MIWDKFPDLLVQPLPGGGRMGGRPATMVLLQEGEGLLLSIAVHPDLCTAEETMWCHDLMPSNAPLLIQNFCFSNPKH